MKNEIKKNFSFDTISNFDKHILESIPNYDVLFSSINKLTDYFRNDSKKIYDIGCSTGNLLNYIARTTNFKGEMIGLDYSINLLPKENQFPNIQFIHYNLNNSYVFNNASIIFSIFTLQFLLKENRLKLLKSVYDGLCKGGAFIIAEKVYAEVGSIQDMFTFAYYDYKKESFTEKEILDKETDLRLILKPNTTEENLNLFNEAGFSKCYCFWKYFNFEAYICIK